MTAALRCRMDSTSKELTTRESPFLSDFLYQLPGLAQVSFHTCAGTMLIRFISSSGVHTTPLAVETLIPCSFRSSCNCSASSGASQYTCFLYSPVGFMESSHGKGLL
ncbi:MAG: hypothetical protein CVU57_03390 [Deltaproteobacteria bacterium HGW-Deltaproteobacteria-15]|nr:MAG: hypothetical protein CVU57_03390 [Deltaproteobacteria bacterium HGW-Deltaproteobacteria-15]